MIAPGNISPFWIGGKQYRSATAESVISSFPNPLANGEAGKVAQVVDTMVDSGNWAKNKTLACLAMADPVNALWDWKRQVTYTAVNSPVHVANKGYLFDGSANYINTNFVPSTGGLLLNDTHIECYCYENLDTTDTVSLYGALSTDRLFIQQQPGHNTRRN